VLRKVSTAAGTNLCGCVLVSLAVIQAAGLLDSSPRSSTQLRTSWAGSMQYLAPRCMRHAQYSESQNAYAMLSPLSGRRHTMAIKSFENVFTDSIHGRMECVQP